MGRIETSPAFSNSTISFLGFVTNYGKIHLLSIFVPSSTSIVISRKDDNSIGRTPSGSTLSVASTILILMNLSFLIDVEATTLVSILPSKSRAYFSDSFTNSCTIFVIPFLHGNQIWTKCNIWQAQGMNQKIKESNKNRA